MYGNWIRDKIYTTQEFPLGAKVEDQDGRVFKFVKYYAGTDVVVGVAGRLAIALDSAYEDNAVTMDYSGAGLTAIPAKPEGFLQAAFTDLTFGWVQTFGDNMESMLTDGSVAQGERLMKHATTDGGIDTHDDTSAIVVAVAKEADTGTALTAGQAKILLETV